MKIIRKTGLELIIIALLYLVCYFSASILLGKYLNDSSFDLQVHDTYVVLSLTTIALIAFLHLGAFVYGMRFLFTKIRKPFLGIITSLLLLGCVLQAISYEEFYKSGLLLMKSRGLSITGENGPDWRPSSHDYDSQRNEIKQVIESEKFKITLYKNGLWVLFFLSAGLTTLSFVRRKKAIVVRE